MSARTRAHSPFIGSPPALLRDLDLNGHKLLFADLLIRQINVNTLGVRNLADTLYKNWTINSLTLIGHCGMSDNKEVRAASGGAFNYHLSAWDIALGNWEKVATIQGHATEPYMGISRAGDIVPAVNNSYDCGKIGKVFKEIRGTDYYGTTINAGNVRPTLESLIPQSVLATAATFNERYNATTDVFEIYDGAVWRERLNSVYGGISVVGNTTQTAIAVAGTPVQYTLFDTDDGENQADADHTNDHILIQKAGTYMIIVSIHADSIAGVGAAFDFQIYKNNGATSIPHIHAHRSFAGGGGEIASIGLSGIASLSVNDTIELWVTNDTNTQNIILTDVTLSLMRIGS